MNLDISDSYILVNDIDCSDTINWNSGLGFNPIANNTVPFQGILDGDFYTISDLYINRTSSFVSMLGYIGVNSTHYLNVNKAMVHSNNAVIDNFLNEFDPNSWSLYVLKSHLDSPSPTPTITPLPTPAATSSPIPTIFSSPTLFPTPTPTTQNTELEITPELVGSMIIVIAIVASISVVLKFKKK